MRQPIAAFQTSVKPSGSLLEETKTGQHVHQSAQHSTAQHSKAAAAAAAPPPPPPTAPQQVKSSQVTARADTAVLTVVGSMGPVLQPDPERGEGDEEFRGRWMRYVSFA